MIDIEKAYGTFNEYIKNYNPEQPKINIKIDHIKRVADTSKDLATKLGLSKEDVELAQLIGLLHDIGRFEQIKIYNTFNDGKSINHGEFGAKILFEDGLIRKFIEDDQYDNIIKTAIVNHNKNKIQDGLNERELLHAKIIRDSDKTDIYKVLSTEDIGVCYETKDMSKEIISQEIYREFMEDHSINYKNRKSSADTLVCHFAYVFDYNFDYGLQLLLDNKYIDNLYKRFEFEDDKTKKMCDEIYIATKEYIYNKLKK